MQFLKLFQRWVNSLEEQKSSSKELDSKKQEELTFDSHVERTQLKLLESTNQKQRLQQLLKALKSSDQKMQRLDFRWKVKISLQQLSYSLTL